MTKNEALEYFEEIMVDGVCNEDCVICNANIVAIEALKESIEREENKSENK